MRKANFWFDQNKNKREIVPNWKSKKPNIFEQRRKDFQPNKNFNNSINYQKNNNYSRNNYKNNGQQGYSVVRNKDVPKNNDNKANIKCWIFQEFHYARDFPQNKKNYSNVNLVQAKATVGDVARETQRISVALENQQVDHQTSMAEIEGMINRKPVSILIDPSASLSYISPGIVEKCNLSLRKFEKFWLVQLATGTKRKVVNFIKSCELFMNDFQTHVNLNLLSLSNFPSCGGKWLR